MSELTRADIENFRYYAGGDLADRICTLALQAYSTEQQAKRAEAEAARLLEEIAKAEATIRYGTPALAQERLSKALQSAPPASEAGERCELCEGDGRIPALVEVENSDGSTGYTAGDIECPECQPQDTTRATTGEREGRIVPPHRSGSGTPPMDSDGLYDGVDDDTNHSIDDFVSDPAPADRLEPSEALEAHLTVIRDNYHHTDLWVRGFTRAMKEACKFVDSQPVPAVPEGILQQVRADANAIGGEHAWQQGVCFALRKIQEHSAAPTPSEGGTHD